MSPATHFLASWSIADLLRLRGRDQALLTWCGVLPDADGLGVLVDGVNQLLGRDPMWHFYGTYHHVLLHGLCAAVTIPAAMSCFAMKRLRVFAVGLLIVHFHLLCDIVGSRGPGSDDIWPLAYLSPFSQAWSVRWSLQWPLNAWPNIAITLLLMVFALRRAIHDGYSPFNAFGGDVDRVFVEKVRRIWHAIKWGAVD